MTKLLWTIFFLFRHDPDSFEDIPSMPGQKRIGCNHLIEFLNPLVLKNLKCVLLFGICQSNLKVFITL